LSAGYAVIFMHRQFSLQPFSRHYSHSTHPFLDFLEVSDNGIEVTGTERDDLIRVVKEYKRAQTAGTLLTLTFVTVNDYLWLLRAVSQEMSVLGRHSMFYLAAAVSDFFLPTQKIVRYS
jgi:phosphopantothenate-cysteine ligase